MRPQASTLNECDLDNDFSPASKSRLFKTASRNRTIDLFWRQKTRITVHALFFCSLPAARPIQMNNVWSKLPAPDQVHLMSKVTDWGRQVMLGAWTPESQRGLKKMNWNGGGWKKHEPSFLKPSNVSGILGIDISSQKTDHWNLSPANKSPHRKCILVPCWS